MNQPQNVMLSIPVKATYSIKDGRAVCTSKTYADISADEMARFLMRGFGVSFPANVEGSPEPA